MTKTTTTTKLMTAMEVHAPLKYSHTVSVVEIAEKIMGQMDLTNEVKEVVLETARLHNLGWNMFSAEFCAYEGKYTDEQFALMRTYPQVGAEMLQAKGYSAEIVEGVLHHADNFSEQQPLASRIVRLARDFRKCLEKYASLEEALSDVQGFAGKGYDPMVVNALAKSNNQ